MEMFFMQRVPGMSLMQQTSMQNNERVKPVGLPQSPSLLTLLLLASVYSAHLTPTVVAFPSGGPFVICADPYPHHHHELAQNALVASAPFEVILSHRIYEPNDSIRVTIRPKHGSQETRFLGYQIAAHPVMGRWDTLLGNFTITPTSSVKYKYYSDDYNCVTHSSRAANNEVSFVWKAPPHSAGDIIFSATVLVDYHTFWVNVSAVLIADSRRAEQSALSHLAPQPHEVTVPKRIPTLRGCGETIGCLLWPRYCTSFDDCDYGVTYSTVGGTSSNSIRFQLFGRTPGFLSLGLSLDQKMDNDETLSCLFLGGRLLYQHGYNPEYYNARVTEDAVSNISMRHEDGVLFCEFIRPVAVNVTAYGGRHRRGMMTELFDLRQPIYHVYLGWGGVYPGSEDSMMKHDELPVVSAQPINFFVHEAGFFNAIPWPIQAHATLMLVAWMGCASIASTVARYSRSNLLGRRKLGGQAAWFQVHRSLLFLSAVLVVASLIVVFLFVGGWTKVATIHASLGIASCALMAAQIVAGLCRPSPTSSRRPIYAWIHRVGGVIAWLCAAASSVLGVNIMYFPAQIATWGTAVLGVWIGCQILVVILFEILRCSSVRSETVVVNLQDASIAEKERSKGGDETVAVKTFLTLFYICCMIGLLFAALAMVWFY